jgi:hypothetical protein
MLSVITIAVTAVLLATSAVAAPPTNETAEQLLAVLQTERQLIEKLSKLDELNRRSFLERFGPGATLTSDQQRAVEIAVNTASQVMRRELAWPTVKPGLILIIKETFEPEELAGILAFYATPAGQAFLRKFPLVEQKSAQHINALAGPAFQKVQAEIEKALDEANLPR